MSVPGKILLTFFSALAFFLPARAVEDTSYVGPPADYDNVAPSFSGWDEGWNETGVIGTTVTGWNYIGQINSDSAVYLGDGWVLTANHVDPTAAEPFTLNSVTYQPVPGSLHLITNDGVDTSIDPSLAGVQPDLSLYQIEGNPTLPALPPLYLTLTQPTAPFANTVVMIGYGGGYGETWGQNTVTQTNFTTSLEGYNYLTLDFVTQTGMDLTADNTALLVEHDSGGGDFIYNSTDQEWELAGINEGYGSVTDSSPDGSYMVQLSDYDAQIEGIMAAPEPPASLLLGSGLAAIGCWLGWRRRRADAGISS